MKVIINDNILKVKVSATPDSISKGMMGKKFDKSFDGMLFFMGIHSKNKIGDVFEDIVA